LKHLADLVLFRKEFETFHVEDYMFGLRAQVRAFRGVIVPAFLAFVVFHTFVFEELIETFLQRLGLEG
jgi:hypothetical protein